MLVKAGYQFTDVLLDPSARHADQRPLDVVHELPRLSQHGAGSVDGSGDDALSLGEQVALEELAERVSAARSVY